MGKVKSCPIELTSSSGVYRPGDSVKGVATVDIEGELKVRAIDIFCRGQALTRWERFMQKLSEDDSESTEIYFYKYINAYSANPPTLMAAGIYKYNFSFKLPSESIPSSFEGFLGAIRYWIEVEVDKPFPSINNRFYRCFTVLANLDMNESVYTRPVRGSGQKPLSKALGIGNAGTVTSSVSLDRSGYCPGEQICINLQAKNNSTKDLGRVKASLVQIVNYKAAHSRDSTTSAIRTVQSDKLRKGESVNWTRQLLKVDFVPPSSKPLACHIIEVSYIIKVEVEVPLGLDLEIRIPITIGTIPRGVSPPSVPAGSGAAGSSAPIMYTVCTAGYRECDKTTRGFPNLNYTPRTVMVKAASQHQATCTNASPVAKTPSVAAAKAAKPLSPVTVTKHSKEVEANQPVSDVKKDLTDCVVLPSYEEACADLVTATPKPQHIPIEPGNGSILMLLFPSADASLVGEAFKRNAPNLLLHEGRVLAFMPETQLRVHPSQQLALVLIRFHSDRIGLSWLQNMTYSNTDLSNRWYALIGESKTPNAFIGGTAMYSYKHLSVKLFKHNAEFKHSKRYWDEYRLLLKQAYVPAKTKHGIRSLVSGKVTYACGDWSSFPAKASELLLVVTGFPDLRRREAFLQECDSNPEIRRWQELFKMYRCCLFDADVEAGDVARFQDL